MQKIYSSFLCLLFIFNTPAPARAVLANEWVLSPTLQRLSNDTLASTLNSYIRDRRTIIVLTLDHCQIGPGALSSLQQLMRSDFCPNCLEFKGSRLSKDQIRNLLNTLSSPRLQLLKFNNGSFPSDGFHFLINFLRQSPPLKDLIIIGTPVPQDSSLLLNLATAILEDAPLETFKLTDSGLTNKDLDNFRNQIQNGQNGRRLKILV